MNKRQHNWATTCYLDVSGGKLPIMLYGTQYSWFYKYNNSLMTIQLVKNQID